MRKCIPTLLLCVVCSPLAFGEGEAKKDPPALPAWLESFTPKGDLRYRYDSVDEEGKDTRNRHRIRARVGFDAKANSEADIGFRLATSQGNDPVSTNQTLSDGFSKKDVFVDLAFLDYHPAVFQDTHVVLGKMENPFIKPADLVWDNDLTPEGLAAKKVFASDQFDIPLNAGGFVVQERADSSDTVLYGVQGGVKYKQKDLYGLINAGYFAYNDIKGKPTIFDSTKGFGNTTTSVLDETGAASGQLLYANDYKLFNLNGEVGFDVGMPLALYSDYVVNADADTEDTGYMFGGRLGKPKDPGDLEFEYNYRHLEKDAVLGIFTDSDSCGGGTNCQGHRFSVGIQVAKNLKAAFTYFLDEKNIADNQDKNYDRFFIDLMAKF